MKRNTELEERLSTVIAIIIIILYTVVLFLASLQHSWYGYLISIGILYFMLFGAHTKED